MLHNNNNFMIQSLVVKQNLKQELPMSTQKISP